MKKLIVELVLCFVHITLCECDTDDTFFKAPRAREESFFSDASTQTEARFITSPDEFDASKLLSRRDEFICAKRSLILYKLIIKSISKRMSKFAKSASASYTDLSLNIKIYSSELEELDVYLNYLSRMFIFEEEHLDGDLSLETKHFCTKLGTIETKFLQLIKRVEGEESSLFSFLWSFWSNMSRRLEWLRMDMKRDSMETLKFYGLYLAIQLIFAWGVYFHPLPPLSQAQLTIFNVILSYSFFEYYHKLRSDFEIEQDRQMMLLSMASKDSNSWLYKYMPWKNAQALEAEAIGERQQFKKSFLEVSILFSMHYMRLIFHSLTQFFVEYIDVLYKPSQAGAWSWLYKIMIQPLLVIALTCLLLYTGLIWPIFGRVFNVFSFLNDSAQSGGQAGNISNTSNNSNTSNTNITYNIQVTDKFPKKFIPLILKGSRKKTRALGSNSQRIEQPLEQTTLNIRNQQRPKQKASEVQEKIHEKTSSDEDLEQSDEGSVEKENKSGTSSATNAHKTKHKSYSNILADKDDNAADSSGSRHESSADI